ncbi:MAG TPA: hypothetical protein VN880_11660 [Solirubrobacteraceae bacterium]|jgi:hypothetical protein|nr:hypothetical protein [Solirubrobacteraceae bacterium]
MGHPTQTPDASGAEVIYLNCPRCGLTVTPKADWLAVEHCPRCIARRGSVVRLFASTLPADALYAADARPDADGLDLGVSSKPGEDGAGVGP